MSENQSGEQPEQDPPPRARKPRRAVRPASTGVDPTPSDHVLTSRAREDLPDGWGAGGGANEAQAVVGDARRTTPQRASRSSGKKTARARGENDDRLERDRPPHWG